VVYDEREEMKAKLGLLKFILPIALLICGAVLGGFFLSKNLSRGTTWVENPTEFTITSFLQARRILGYEQPPRDLVDVISKVYRDNDKAEEVLPKAQRGLPLVLIDDLPFYNYWQGEEGAYQFHPMALGIFLASLSCDEAVSKYLDAAVRTAHSLPNGGLLWYYPDNYRLSRFLGPDLTPSAISQGQILGAITNLDQRCSLDLSHLARRAFLGLAFSYYEGGVNLENRALLEFPLFRSAPEIILNGWLHALLYLRQYADHYDDPEAKALLTSNLEFLGQIIDSFYHEATGLSLYSNLCPYRVRIHHESGPPRQLFAFYKARVPNLSDLVFELVPINHDTRSPYDNQIIAQTEKTTDVWVSCSQFYETYLVAEGGPFSITFNTGIYSPHQSTQGSGGEQVQLTSTQVGGYHMVRITAVRNKLFCGYPTNFLKNGENYYHTYHIVALACILASFDLSKSTRTKLGTWMEKWIQTVDELSAKGFAFTSYQAVLDELVEHQACSITRDWETLLRMAREAG
jgi:hypothetical protein